MAVLYGINQIKVTPELPGGGVDGSAVAIPSDDIQSMDITPVYVDGNEATLRGGDSIKAVVKEEDTFRGVDITISNATFNAELKKAIVGGTVTGAVGSEKWSAPDGEPENDPFPFRLEVWVTNYTKSDSESTEDGFIEYVFAFCKGRLGSQGPADQVFAVDQFVIRARRNESNPSLIEPAITEEEVAEIPGI